MTTPTINNQTHTDLNTNITQPDSMTILQSTAEQAGLQTFVETSPVSSPNFRRPSPRPHIRSRQLTRLSGLDQIRQRNGTRERAAKTRFVATRTDTRKDGHSKLLEAMRRCRLSKSGKNNMAAKIGVLAVNGGKHLLSSSKKEIVGLPGLFDADMLAELTTEDCFLGPMKRAIINKDITSFNKLGAYMAQFWPTAAVVNNCVVIDNKLAIPESLRQAVLTRLHRSHPGQEAMMTASEYLWWPFMIRQIIETCEKCRECTLFGKNLKPASTFNTAKSLPVLSGPNQELQLDFAGPILDEKGSKIFLLVAIDRFSKFPSVLISKTTGAKKVTKFLDSYIRIHGLPRSIRTDHGSGFKNNLVQEFGSNRGIKHILSPVGDHRGSGLERSIQTIKRKLGVAKRDPNFRNLKDTIHQILEDIRKSNHSVLKKSPFELHFGRKPNTVWSQARNIVVQSDTSAQILERNLLTPDQIASNDYSRDSTKVVPRGSSSPTIPTHCKPLFSLDGNVADSEPYKALADLARVANKWSHFRRNLPPDAGKLVLKELTTRHLDLAHSLKSGLNSNTLRFSVIASPPGTQVSSRRAPVVQPTRLSRTSKLENLLLSDPGRVKVFRKIIDRQSGKPLYKLTKFKIVRVTDHTYITDKGKVYRKNHICLKPIYRSAILVAQNSIGDRVQASSSTSRGAAKRPVTRSQSVLLEQRPNNPSLSTPMVDLTADSSSESPIGSNNDRQVARDSVTTGKRQRLQCDSPPVRFARQFASTSTPQSSTHATHSRNIDSTHQPVGSFVSPQPGTLHRAVLSSSTRPMEPPEILHLVLI